MTLHPPRIHCLVVCVWDPVFNMPLYAAQTGYGSGEGGGAFFLPPFSQRNILVDRPIAWRCGQLLVQNRGGGSRYSPPPR